jgi:TonB family protein
LDGDTTQIIPQGTKESDIAMQQIMLKKAVLSGSAIAIFSLWTIAECAAHDAMEQTYIAPAIINLNFCKPAYPRDALLRSEQGVVKLEFTIGVKGRLIGSRIVKSSGFRELDTAALTALMHCSFQPAYRNGVPVQAAFTIDYTWSFNSAVNP